MSHTHTHIKLPSVDLISPLCAILEHRKEYVELFEVKFNEMLIIFTFILSGKLIKINK